MDKDFWITIYGVGLAFAIQIAYDGINEFPNLSRGFWFGLTVDAFILAFLILVRGRRLTTKEEEQKEELKDKEKDERKPDTQSMIAEYRVLNEAIWRRGRDNILMIALIIPATLGLVTFAIQSRGTLGLNDFTGLSTAGFVPLVSLALIIFSYIWVITSTKLDNICFERIHKIEDILGIEGHRFILERLKCKTWFKVRRNMWHLIFPLFIIAYLFTAYWLFTHTIIP